MDKMKIAKYVYDALGWWFLLSVFYLTTKHFVFEYRQKQSPVADSWLGKAKVFLCCIGFVSLLASCALLNLEPHTATITAKRERAIELFCVFGVAALLGAHRAYSELLPSDFD